MAGFMQEDIDRYANTMTQDRGLGVQAPSAAKPPAAGGTADVSAATPWDAPNKQSLISPELQSIIDKVTSSSLSPRDRGNMASLAGVVGGLQQKRMDEQGLSTRLGVTGAQGIEKQKLQDVAAKERTTIASAPGVMSEKRLSAPIPGSGKSLAGVSGLPTSEAQEDLTPSQLQAMTGVINAKTQRIASDTTEKRLGIESRRADVAERQLGLTEQRYADMNANDKARLAFDVQKFAETNDLKNPINVMKLAASLGGTKSITTYDNEGNPVTTKEPDLSSGFKALKEMGYKIPEGLKEKAPSIDMTAPPPAGLHKGRIIRGSDGTRLQSDGTNWNPVR